MECIVSQHRFEAIYEDASTQWMDEALVSAAGFETAGEFSRVVEFAAGNWPPGRRYIGSVCEYCGAVVNAAQREDLP